MWLGVNEQHSSHHSRLKCSSIEFPNPQLLCGGVAKVAAHCSGVCVRSPSVFACSPTNGLNPEKDLVQQSVGSR